MAIKQSVLRSKANAPTALTVLAENSRQVGNKDAQVSIKTAFLCHSHHDKKLVEGFIVLLRERGIELYVDWKDMTMPEKPNAETAKRIKSEIKSNDIFLFLATANSRSSRWCPWEIGCADEGGQPIYIITTEDDQGTSYGNEYLDLYPRIDTGSSEGKSDYAVFEPGMNRGKWLSKTALMRY
jgi:hypothetical protein